MFFADPEFIGGFVLHRLPHLGNAGDFGTYSAIGICKGNTLIAGFIYSCFTGFDCELTVASDDPCWARRRDLITALFRYPFVQLGCTRMTISTMYGDNKASKLARGLGFWDEGIKRRGYDGVNDAQMFGMLREECRWLE